MSLLPVEILDRICAYAERRELKEIAKANKTLRECALRARLKVLVLRGEDEWDVFVELDRIRRYTKEVVVLCAPPWDARLDAGAALKYLHPLYPKPLVLQRLVMANWGNYQDPWVFAQVSEPRHVSFDPAGGGGPSDVRGILHDLACVGGRMPHWLRVVESLTFVGIGTEAERDEDSTDTSDSKGGSMRALLDAFEAPVRVVVHLARGVKSIEFSEGVEAFFTRRAGEDEGRAVEWLREWERSVEVLDEGAEGWTSDAEEAGLRVR